MTDREGVREFRCGGRTWRVTPHATAACGHTGLYFRCDGDRRFLAFTRGALSSARELDAMSDEVLCVLLLRAAVE